MTKPTFASSSLVLDKNLVSVVFVLGFYLKVGGGNHIGTPSQAFSPILKDWKEIISVNC